jgi:hypothetical protein
MDVEAASEAGRMMRRFGVDYSKIHFRRKTAFEIAQQSAMQSG